MTVFRIVQEALTNVFRHSEARKAHVAVMPAGNQVVRTICDDGKGIEPSVEQVRPEGLGVGISGMKHRVKEFGGTLRLQRTEPGTVVQAVLPVSSVVARV